MDGIEVHVVALRDDFTEMDAERWLPLRPRVANVVGPGSFGFSPDLRELMDSKADVGYCAALWKYPACAVMDWQKRSGKPVVVAPHGSLDAWALRNSRWKKRVAAALFKDRQLRRATCFRALCDAEADSIRAYGLKQRIEIVPNGVVLPEVEQSKVGPEGARLAGASKSKDTECTERKKRLLFLGRIHPKKGLAGALRSWAEIHNSKSKNQNSKKWQFVIAGWDQGGHEGDLKALCGELGLKVFSFQGSVFSKEDADVVFQGPAFGAEKEALLRSADAFILPSLSEGLPMSVLEAWAYGLPVVMTRECHLPEGFARNAALEIRSGEGSFQGSDLSFQHGLLALLEMSGAERDSMGMRGRRLVEEKFTWSKVAAQMRTLYEELSGG